jgi:hypothetical protein
MRPLYISNAVAECISNDSRGRIFGLTVAAESNEMNGVQILWLYPLRDGLCEHVKQRTSPWTDPPSPTSHPEGLQSAVNKVEAGNRNGSGLC